jgi:hypothetical protein
MYTNNHLAFRQAFFVAWQKYQKKLPLEQLEAELIEVILLHPEYHPIIEQTSTLQQQEFAIEENPFVHMSLHLAIREQVNTNRPTGITLIHQQLQTHLDQHTVEHQMMTCLAQLLWQAQQNGVMENDEIYLEKLRELSQSDS